MGIIYQHDKRSNITYVYENKAYWDKEKGQSRAHRTLIGRLDEKTGEIIPTDGRVKKAQQKAKEPDYKKLYFELKEKYEAQGEELEQLRKRLG